MPPKKKRIEKDSRPELGEVDNDALSYAVKVLLQEKVKQVEEKMQQLVSLLARGKSESEEISKESRIENNRLKKELGSVKTSTRSSLEQNQKDIQDIVENFIAEKKLIENKLIFANEKIRKVTEDSEKLDHESMLKESMNCELLAALTQKEEQYKQASKEMQMLKAENLAMFDKLLSNPHEEDIREYKDELSKVKSENDKLRGEIKQVVTTSVAKICQLKEENIKSNNEIAILREDVAKKASTLENIREVKLSYKQAARLSKEALEDLKQQNSKLTKAREELENQQEIKIEEQCAEVSELQAELGKAQIALLVKSESEQIIQELKSEVLVLTESNEKYAIKRIGDFESLRDLEDELEKAKWQNSELMEAAEIQSRHCIEKMKCEVEMLNEKLTQSESTVMGKLKTIRELDILLRESDTVYKEMESERRSSLFQFNQTIVEKDKLMKSLQLQCEKLKINVSAEKEKLKHLNDQHSSLKRESKEYESLFVKRLTEQLSDTRDGEDDSLLMILKREMTSKETADIKKLKAERDAFGFEIKEYQDKVKMLTEESNKNKKKVRVIETKRKNQDERIDLVLKMKSEEVKKLSEQNMKIILEKEELQTQFSALLTDSNLQMIKIQNLESEQLQAANVLDLKRKSEIEERESAGKKNEEMTNEIMNLADENSTMHFKMNTLQRRLDDQTTESGKMKKTLELFKSEQTERDSLADNQKEREANEKENLVEMIKSLKEENANIFLKVDTLEDEMRSVKRESNLKVSKSIELLELDKLKHRESLNLAEISKNKVMDKMGEENKLLRVQKVQMQAYFLQLESKVGEREKEIKVLRARWKDEPGEERRVVFRGDGGEAGGERGRIRGEEEIRKERHSRERHTGYNGQKERGNHRRY